MRTILSGIGLGVCLLIAFGLGRLTMPGEISKNSLSDPACCAPAVLPAEANAPEEQVPGEPTAAPAEGESPVAEAPAPIEARLRPKKISVFSAPEPPPASIATDAIQRFRSGLQQLELDRKQAVQERTQ